MIYRAGFKFLKWNCKPILRFKMRFYPYSDPCSRYGETVTNTWPTRTWHECTCYTRSASQGSTRRSRNLSGGRALSRHFFSQVTWEGSRKLIEIRVLSAFLGYFISWPMAHAIARGWLLKMIDYPTRRAILLKIVLHKFTNPKMKV